MMRIANAYVIGVDFGTDSVRTIIVDAQTGKEISSSVFFYTRWKKQLFCNANKNQFRQHPQDYIDGLETTIRDAVSKAGTKVAAGIRGLSIDTTGSTPVAINKAGVPLALLREYENNPNAMFVLWKDHSSVKEASDWCTSRTSRQTWKARCARSPIVGVGIMQWRFPF